MYTCRQTTDTQFGIAHLVTPLLASKVSCLNYQSHVSLLLFLCLSIRNRKSHPDPVPSYVR